MIRKLLSSFALMVLGTFAAHADGDPRDAAVAMDDRAVAYLEANGLDALTAASMDPANTDFHENDLHVIVFNHDGTCVAHGVNPKLAGQNHLAIKDPFGATMTADMSALVQNEGTGWVDCHWAHPGTRKATAKSTYVTALGPDHFVGVGIWTE